MNVNSHRHSPEAIAASVATLRQRLGDRVSNGAPQIAIVLGSGWGDVSALVEDAVDVPYSDLPAFPVLGVGGHTGTVRAGRIGQGEAARQVLVLAGRQHTYETGEADGMKGAVRTLAALGIRLLVQTNAAGSMDEGMRPGELMLISDHLNISQRSPLFGEPGDDRFVDMSSAYNATLRLQALSIAASAGITLHEGVYAWFVGPQFETPAEIRMLRVMGGNAVGMSTVPETILARHAGMQVLALSLLTNMAAGMDKQALSHAHTLATARSSATTATRLMAALVGGLQINRA